MNHPTISDDAGNIWFKCDLKDDCRLEVIRPGVAQCECEILDDDFDYFDDWDEDDLTA